MASDVRELIERAADAPALSRSDVDRIMGRAQRMRRRSLLLRAVVALLLVGTTITVYFGVMHTEHGPSVRIGSASGSVLIEPARGAVSAEWLKDGTPVWVVHHDDNTVTILSAIPTDASFGLDQLVGWCPSARGFEDGMYGSTWDERGHYRGGPAPSDLASAQGRVLDHGRVSVGPLVVRNARTAPEPRSGLECFANRPVGYDPGTTKRHKFSRKQATTLRALTREIADRPSGRVKFVTDVAIVVADESVRLCAARPSTMKTVCTNGPSVEGIDAASIRARYPGAFVVIRGDLLLRIGDGTLSDVTFVRGYNITSVSPVS